MKLALECPDVLLKEIQSLTDFDFILTHLVLKDGVYAKYYRESSSFKILDNSVNELGEPCSLEEMVQALDILGGADLIVPPDYLGDFEATRNALDQSLSLWEHDKLLPVVQGGITEEVLDYACYLDVKMGFNFVAVPYDLTCKKTDSRDLMAVSRDCIVRNLTKSGLEVHLLGFTTVEELIGYQGNPKVKSVDTGVPVVYGMNLKHLDEPWGFKKDKPTMDQIEESPPGFLNDKLSAIYYNIAYLRKILGSV